MATTTEKQKPTYEELVAVIQKLQARIVELEEELANARKNSETSSKPPSSSETKSGMQPTSQYQMPYNR